MILNTAIIPFIVTVRYTTFIPTHFIATLPFFKAYIKDDEIMNYSDDFDRAWY